MLDTYWYIEIFENECVRESEREEGERERERERERDRQTDRQHTHTHTHTISSSCLITFPVLTPNMLENTF